MLAHLLPGAAGQLGLEARKAPFGRAHQVVDRRLAPAHLLQHFFGRDAAVHQPDARGLAVARLDFLEEISQRGVVGRVAGEHLVGHRETLGRDHQGHHHLHAIAALVAAVAEAALVVFIQGRVRLEVGAGQVVEQHFVTRAEEQLPTLAQVAEQVLLVRGQLVQATVERVLLREGEVLAQEVGHCRALEPKPVQAPLAAGIDQAVGHQGFQDIEPRSALARGKQTVAPEIVQGQLVPQFERQPAGAPLARARQHEAVHVDLDRRRPRRRLAVLGKERKLDQAVAAGEGVDGAAPDGALALADLAQVEQGFLDGAPAADAAVFHHAPVAVEFAIFAAGGRA